MAKARKLIPGTVLASVLSVPAVTFSHGAGAVPREQVQAAQVQPQRASYRDRTSVASDFPMTFEAAMMQIEAQRQAFELYGGASSSSDVRSAA